MLGPGVRRAFRHLAAWWIDYLLAEALLAGVDVPLVACVLLFDLVGPPAVGFTFALIVLLPAHVYVSLTLGWRWLLLGRRGRATPAKRWLGFSSTRSSLNEVMPLTRLVACPDRARTCAALMVAVGVMVVVGGVAFVRPVADAAAYLIVGGTTVAEGAGGLRWAESQRASGAV